ARGKRTPRMSDRLQPVSVHQRIVAPAPSSARFRRARRGCPRPCRDSTPRVRTMIDPVDHYSYKESSLNENSPLSSDAENEPEERKCTPQRQKSPSARTCAIFTA